MPAIITIKVSRRIILNMAFSWAIPHWIFAVNNVKEITVIFFWFYANNTMLRATFSWS